MFPLPNSKPPGVFAEMNQMFNRVGIKFDKLKQSQSGSKRRLARNDVASYGDAHLLKLDEVKSILLLLTQNCCIHTSSFISFLN